MEWEFIHLAKPAFKETEAWVAEYQKRLKREISFRCITLKDEKRLIEHLDHTPGLNIILDERGSSVSSMELSSKISQWRSKKLVRFTVGGSYGLTDKTRARADWLWSLSELTLPGDIAWVLLWEQIFRGFSILRKSGYHHGA